MENRAVIGIPRGMLYYRYETLWQVFFREIGVDFIISEPTRQDTAERGSALAVDEACLSLKLFLGHVDALVGKCEYILIPRINSYGRNQELCPRFSALYDIAINTFRDKGQKFLPFSIDSHKNETEQDAFLCLGQALGVLPRKAKKAYETARKEDQRLWKSKIQAQNALCSTDGLKILIAAHSYVIEDAYIGTPILEFLQRNHAAAIRADIVDRENACKHSPELSPTCKWELSREILGGVLQRKDKVDGIILLSTFPCGPDAMVNDILLRKLHDKPVLNLVLDGQSGTAGLETRLESFLDIIRFKKGLL